MTQWIRAVRLRRGSHGMARWIAAAAGAALVACSSAPPPAHPTITPERLLAGAGLPIDAVAPPSIPNEAEILAVNPAMDAFLEEHVVRSATPELRLRQLVSAIIDSKSFGVEYDDRTRTASETFRVRRGNCLSFSTLFVALARRVGLRAEYQEVDVPPDWTLEKDTFVLNQHVNVWIDLEGTGTRVVDFNIADFKATYDLRRITDARARAHYYNNVGVEQMQAGDREAALACFRRAIEADATFSPAWGNLGTFYLRQGVVAAAEAAYLQAVQSGPWDLVAMSNLARLYATTGDFARADAYRNRVAVHRNGNPYYRFDLARRAYAARRFDDAIANLEYAIRKRPQEDEFYFLLGLSWLQKGDERRAKRWLTRAEEVAGTDALKRRYSRKIEILMKNTPAPPGG